MNSANQARGFSLIELLIVIALIAIMAAFAVPTWQRYSANAALKAAAVEMKTDLFNAKQQALEENVDVYRMTFSPALGNYALSRTDTGVTLWTRSLGPGISIQSADFSGGTVVSFQRRGTMSSGSVVLRNGLTSTATITVNITGRAYVEYVLR
jgi:prepilin-type N-terminal cleavage/methylation domain-containing protein